MDRERGPRGPSTRGPRRPRSPQRAPGASSLPPGSEARGEPVRVAVTRPRGADEEEDRLSALLRSAGCESLAHPLLRIEGPPDLEAFERAMRSFFDRPPREAPAGRVTDNPERRPWVLFSSRNAVPPFLEHLARLGDTPEGLVDAGVRVGAVGRATAEALESAGVPVALVPGQFTAEALLASFLDTESAAGEGAASSAPLRHVDVFLPRAAEGREVLEKGLAEAGARVHVGLAYRVVRDPDAARRLMRAVHAGSVDIVTLTSGSAAEMLADARDAARGGEWPAQVRIAAIGPVTARAARERGLEVALMPRESSLEALVGVVVGGAR